MDELTEMVTLIQTGKIPANVPAILIGKKYWKPFIDWVNTAMCNEQNFVTKKEVAILQVVDSPEEALKIIKKTKERAFG